MELIKTEAIYRTNDYSMFKFSEINREINGTMVLKIKKSIQKEGLMNPIIVDRNKTIVDGQHRFTALKELGLPITFLIKEMREKATDLIFQLEAINTSKTWTQKQKLGLLAKTNENYKRLNDLVDKYGFTIQGTLNIIYGKSMHLNDVVRNGVITHKGLGFDSGKLILHEEMVLKSLFRFEILKEMKDLFPKWGGRNLVTTIIALHSLQKLDLQRLLDQMKKYPYLTEEPYNHLFLLIDKIYNYRKRVDIVNFVNPKGVR